MNTESNRRVNSRTQSMAWSDFQLLSQLPWSLMIGLALVNMDFAKAVLLPTF